MSDFDTGLRVLAGVLPSNMQRLTYALTRLTPEHFRDKTERSMWTLITNYHDKHGGVLPQAVLKHVLSKSKMDKGEQVLYAQLFVRAKQLSVPDDEFRYAVEALKDDVEHEKTGQIIATAFEILERGVEVDHEVREGHQSAKAYLYEELAALDRASGAGDTPQGYVRSAREEMLREYYAAKDAPDVRGVSMGLETVDKVTGGMMPGDLVLAAAYTGQGKSMLSTQATWHAAIKEGRHAVYVTSETTYPVIRRRLVCRHSREEQFGLPEGLDASKVKDGSLSEAEEEVLRAVLDDLANNPAYGEVNIIQIPRGTTLSQVEMHVHRVNQERPVEFVTIDYLNLLRSERMRDSERAEASEILKNAKMFANSFDGGRAVPVLSPWQITQEAFKIATDLGQYTLRSLAETAEAVRSPDLIVTLLRTPETPKKAKAQVLKVRDGADVPMPFDLDVDYRNAYLAEPANMSYSFDPSTADIGFTTGGFGGF